MTKQETKQNPDFLPFKPMDYGNLLVISVGTGSPKIEHKYDAKMAAKWGIFGWLNYKKSSPLVDCFTQANADMVDYHNSVVFQALDSLDNYLRIDVSFLEFFLSFFFSIMRPIPRHGMYNNFQTLCS